MKVATGITVMLAIAIATAAPPPKDGVKGDDGDSADYIAGFSGEAMKIFLHSIIHLSGHHEMMFKVEQPKHVDQLVRQAVAAHAGDPSFKKKDLQDLEKAATAAKAELKAQQPTQKRRGRQPEDGRNEDEFMKERDGKDKKTDDEDEEEDDEEKDDEEKDDEEKDDESSSEDREGWSELSTERAQLFKRGTLGLPYEAYKGQDKKADEEKAKEKAEKAKEEAEEAKKEEEQKAKEEEEKANGEEEPAEEEEKSKLRWGRKKRFRGLRRLSKLRHLAST